MNLWVNRANIPDPSQQLTGNIKSVTEVVESAKHDADDIFEGSGFARLSVKH